MSSQNNDSSLNRINVLALDGGGIRGLSSLLILKDLMAYINESVKSLKPPEAAEEVIQPHHIFDLVAGTSTGGLIAIMLGKLGMTVDECILAYDRLASDIFGKKHLRARFTGGLAPAKYSGSQMMHRVRTLLKERRLNEDLEMHSSSQEDKIACTVICREHENASRYSDFLPDAVHICSLRCPKQVDCQVCEAARATSAAPTFFPVQKIGERYFADGGMEFNNPSYEVWRHYSQSISIAEARRRSAATDITDTSDHPGGLNFSDIRFVNLGTGDQPNVSELRSKSSKFAILIPAPIRMMLSLKHKLIKMAVSSERIAENMRGLAQVAGGRFSIEYARFSADNGVCFIKLDKYRQMPEITRLTREYLDTAKIQRRLMRLGNDIARDYLAKKNARLEGVLNRLPLPPNNPGRPQTPESQIHARRAASLDTQPSTGTSRNPESSLENTPSRDSSTDVTSPDTIVSPVSSASQQIAEVAEAIRELREESDTLDTASLCLRAAA